MRMRLSRRGASHSDHDRVQQNRHAQSFSDKTRRRVAAASYDAVEGVAIMMPARKNVSAADNRQKGQKACSTNACT